MAGYGKYGYWQNCFNWKLDQFQCIPEIQAWCYIFSGSRRPETKCILLKVTHNSGSCQGTWMCSTQFNSLIKSQKQPNSWLFTLELIRAADYFGVDGWRWKSVSLWFCEAIPWLRFVNQLCLHCFTTDPVHITETPSRVVGCCPRYWKVSTKGGKVSKVLKKSIHWKKS